MLKGNLWYQFEKISYSNDTTCINSNNLNLVENKIANIFKKEGYLPISKPKLPQNSEPLLKEFLARPWLIGSLRIVGLLNGNINWITIKTSTSMLFCHTAKGFHRSLISELAVQSGCNAFHYHVCERYCGVLLEANTVGERLASGYIDHDDINEMVFLNEPVIKTDKEQNFLLLEVPKDFNSAGQIKVNISKADKQKREQNLERLFNEQPEQAQFALSEWKKLNMSCFERTDEDLGKLICPSDSFWHENNLLYKSYAEPEQLKKDEVRLLYFKHKSTDIQNIWSPITSRKDYGVEQDIPF